MAIETTTPSACPAEGNREARKRRLPQYQSLRGTLGPVYSREEPGEARDPPRGAAAVAGTADSGSRCWVALSSRQEAREERESFRRGQTHPDGMSGRGFASFHVRKFPGSQVSRFAGFQVQIYTENKT